LILSVFLMGTLVTFGIGLDLEYDIELGSSRLSFFGSNPNQVGNLSAIAFIFAVHMLFSRKNYFNKKTFLLLLFIPSLISLVSLSGSRGSLVVVGLGFVFLIFLKRGNIRQKLLTIL